MATASANRLMNLSAFSSMYPKNAAGAGIVCRSRKRWITLKGDGRGHVPIRIEQLAISRT